MREHRHSWEIQNSKLETVVVIDDWLGPVTALIKCQGCDAYGLIYLVAWQAPELKNRVFALRVTPDTVTETYLENVSRDYCQLTRKQSETEALFSAADPVSQLISTTEGLVVEKTCTTDSRHPHIPWRDVNPEDYEHVKKGFLA